MNNYEQAVRYSKMAYESCMRLYGPNDLKTSLQLDELIEHYELLEDYESIDLVIKEYHRIKRESSQFELPGDEDEGIPFLYFFFSRVSSLKFKYILNRIK